MVLCHGSSKVDPKRGSTMEGNTGMVTVLAPSDTNSDFSQNLQIPGTQFLPLYTERVNCDDFIHPFQY